MAETTCPECGLPMQSMALGSSTLADACWGRGSRSCLRAQVARLTAERDDAVAGWDRVRSECFDWIGVVGERDEKIARLEREIAELRAELARCRKVEA